MAYSPKTFAGTRRSQISSRNIFPFPFSPRSQEMETCNRDLPLAETRPGSVVRKPCAQVHIQNAKATLNRRYAFAVRRNRPSPIPTSVLHPRPSCIVLSYCICLTTRHLHHNVSRPTSLPKRSTQEYARVNDRITSVRQTMLYSIMI